MAHVIIMIPSAAAAVPDVLVRSCFRRKKERLLTLNMTKIDSALGFWVVY